MITPRRTRLVRVPDLHAFRKAILSCATQGAPDVVGSTAVVVPTRGAARHLVPLFSQAFASSGRPVPALVTRDELYQLLGASFAPPLDLLTGIEREAILHTAAAEVASGGPAPPFRLRPGLVAEMLRFYDQLRRLGQSVDRYEELMTDALDVESDRGAERLLLQTRFLAASFRRYEGRLSAASTADEHVLRTHLIRHQAADPLRRVIVAVGDWIAEPDGLFPADFDMLTRMPGLAEIDVVATAGLLGSGFDQRLHDWLPDLARIEGDALGIEASQVPVLVVPGQDDLRVWIHRDREEELAAVARRADGDLDRTGVVFARPLPYLYLAREVFGGARMPYQALDGLPLAAEPAAAALDLIIEFVSSQFTRASALALLRSPQLVLGTGLSRQALTGLDRALREDRYTGDLDRLRQFVADYKGNDDIRSAASVALRAADALQSLTSPAAASGQLATLTAFLTAHADPGAGERSVRACAALVGVLRSLSAARASHGNEAVTIDDLAPDIRRWVEEQTFAPIAGGAGIHLVDARAARFAEFDALTIVGLIEGEWPEPSRRNIFYSPGLLGALGWPSERDRRSAATALFRDLLRSPSHRILLSTFRFDDEALVEPSFLIEAVEGARLAPVRDDAAAPSSRIFFDDALSTDLVELDALDADTRDWAEFRAARSSGTLACYHGAAGPQAPRPLSVGAIETYLTCPFKHFARSVLRLEEEEDDSDVMDPKRQGRFVHRVFEAFFRTWQERGHRAITPANLDEARRLFEETVETQLREHKLPETEAALERTRLLGSPVAAGLGEVAFRMEAERPMRVVERLLEYRLRGDFDFASAHQVRRIALDGVADRLDLLENGTFRLIDYKLSSAPSKSRALQLPIYGICAEQRLRNHQGRDWTLGEAAYISFRGARKVTPLFTPRMDRATVLESAQERLITAVEAIERGEFPPAPEDVFLCGFCSYGSVCRKDYVGDL